MLISPQGMRTSHAPLLPDPTATTTPSTTTTTRLPVLLMELNDYRKDLVVWGHGWGWLAETEGDGWRVRQENPMYLQLFCWGLDVSASSRTLRRPFKGFPSGGSLESSGRLLPGVSSPSVRGVCWFLERRAPVVTSGKQLNQTIRT